MQPTGCELDSTPLDECMHQLYIYWSSSKVIYVTLSTCLLLPYLFISCTHLTVMILFVQRARTSMAQTRALAIIGPSLSNQLLPSTQSTLLTGERSASFCSLKTALISPGLSDWKSASDWCALQYIHPLLHGLSAVGVQCPSLPH